MQTKLVINRTKPKAYGQHFVSKDK